MVGAQQKSYRTCVTFDRVGAQMNKTVLLATLRRDWEYEAPVREISHEIYHNDAVLEFPQSQERYEGKANFLAWRKLYPAAVDFKLRRIRGEATCG